jgi:rhodanese-related sulfurtransferase
METTNATCEDILRRAEARSQEHHHSYRGEVTPEEAWALLEHEPRARLLDIRAREELTLVGRIPGAIEIELKRFPAWIDNPDFLDKVKEALDPADLVLLICRSGARSHKAAEQLTEEGYRNCFNVLEGFEGERNEKSQRLVSGWRVRGLPWSQ